jgi:hypothetical protein
MFRHPSFACLAFRLMSQRLSTFVQPVVLVVRGVLADPATETALALVRRLLAPARNLLNADGIMFVACYRARRRFSGQVRPMSKQSMREEAERLIRETMEKKNIVIKQGQTRIEAVCGKCGAPNRVLAEKGATRVKFACKQCDHKQETL